MFTVVNAVLLRPIGVDDPDRVVRVHQASRNSIGTNWEYADFLELHARSRALPLEASRSDTAQLTTAPDAAGAAVRIDYVSGGYFSLLGGRTGAGRPLVMADDDPAAAAVAVLSTALWRARFGGDPAVVGRTVWLDGRPTTVVGIGASSFTGVADRAPDVWVPLAALRTSSLGGTPRAFTVNVVGRLPATKTRAESEGEVGSIAAALQEGRGLVDPGARLVAADTRLSGPDRGATRVVAIVAVVVGLVLLLACANVTNLLLASATTRQREMAMRLALGAGRGRLLRQLLSESLLLGLVGGACGLLFTVWVLPFLASLAHAPASLNLSPDWRVLTFLLLVSIGVGIGAGLAPARYGANGDLSAPMKTAGANGRLRSLLVGAQAAGSLVLLVLASLLLRAMVEAARVEPGIDADKLASVSPLFGRGRYAGAAAESYWRPAVDRVAALPGVERTALAEFPPFANGARVTSFVRDGARYTIYFNATTADYFATVGLRRGTRSWLHRRRGIGRRAGGGDHRPASRVISGRAATRSAPPSMTSSMTGSRFASSASSPISP